LECRDEDEAINYRARPTSIDLSHDTETETCPGDGRGGSKPDQGQGAEMAFELLGVTFSRVRIPELSEDHEPNENIPI
jgi:hypothetical protein